MKKIVYIFAFIAFISCDKKTKISQEVEISCGQCNFEMTTQKGCDLAVKIDDKSYFVEGFGIDDFGDAHDEHTGFCSVVRKAKVEGEIKEGKFIASSIVLKD